MKLSRIVIGFLIIANVIIWLRVFRDRAVHCSNCGIEITAGNDIGIDVCEECAYELGK
jgi:hypothetical protein